MFSLTVVHVVTSKIKNFLKFSLSWLVPFFLTYDATLMESAVFYFMTEFPTLTALSWSSSSYFTSTFSNPVYMAVGNVVLFKFISDATCRVVVHEFSDSAEPC